MDFTISHRLQGQIAIVAVGGWIDIGCAPTMRETFIALIEEGHLHLVVDLTEVAFMDSTGLGVLIGLLHRLRSRNGSLVLAGANERVSKVLAIAGLTKVFAITTDIEEAIAAINSGAASV